MKVELNMKDWGNGNEKREGMKEPNDGCIWIMEQTVQTEIDIAASTE